MYTIVVMNRLCGGLILVQITLVHLTWLVEPLFTVYTFCLETIIDDYGVVYNCLMGFKLYFLNTPEMGMYIRQVVS